MRAAALRCCDAFNTSGSFVHLLSACATALASEGHFLRNDILHWLADHCGSQRVAPSEYARLLKPVASALQDRNADVRREALRLVGELGSVVGAEVLRKQASDAGVLASIKSALGDASVSNAASVASRHASGGVPIERTQTQEKMQIQEKSQEKNLNQMQGHKTGHSIGAGAKAAGAAASEANNFPLLMERGKDERCLLSGLSMDQPLRELLERLQECMSSCFAPSILQSLFAHETKDVAFGLKELDAAFGTCTPQSDQSRAVLHCAPLLLAYVAARVLEGLPSIVCRALEALESLFSVLESEKARLQDADANLLLPQLVVRLGDSREVVRQHVQRVLLRVGRVYPLSKTVPHLIEGMDGRHAPRVKTECLEALIAPLERLDRASLSAAKVVPSVVALFSEKDPAIRSAAMRACAACIVLWGPDAQTHVVLNAREMAALEEIVKKRRNGNKKDESALKVECKGDSKDNMNMEAKIKGKSMDGRSIVGKSMDGKSIASTSKHDAKNKTAIAEFKKCEFSLDLDEQKLPTLSTVNAACIARPATPPEPRVSMASSSHPHGYSAVSMIALVRSPDPVQCHQALQKIDVLLHSGSTALVTHANDVVMSAVHQMRAVFDGDNKALYGCMTLLKKIIVLLITLFQNAHYSEAVSRERIRNTMDELLLLLSREEALREMADGPSVVKLANVLVLRILANCEKGALFSALIGMLASGSQTSSVDGLGGRSGRAAFQLRHTELVMKSLWKMTRGLSNDDLCNALFVKDLLLDVHLFFQTVPPYEWKRRAAAQLPLGDLPLKTIKAVLHRVVEVQGENALVMMELVEAPDSSFVSSYLTMMVESSQTGKSSCLEAGGAALEAGGNGLSVCSLAGSSAQASRMDNATTPQTAGKNGGEEQQQQDFSTDEEANVMLSGIFAMIRDQPESQRGLVALYDFRKRYPSREGAVRKMMEAAGDFFLGYINRGLRYIADERMDSSAQSQESNEETLLFSHKSMTGSPIEVYKAKLSSLQKRYAAQLEPAWGAGDSPETFGDAPGSAANRTQVCLCF